MDLHSSELPVILRNLRKEAGYTQGELALRVGLSRETVSAIENNKPESLRTLQIEVVKKWWSVCRTKAKEETRNNFVNQIVGYFKFITDRL
ncbi:helix-turn-helix transcriptional regulator [Paraglaciecola chathamensis]|jgi:DNA-binding XRE family transcriptional regulator|uniref:Helix-turn-helix transcriptional regulator n=3 Tax=Paraglaciecola chathamensis TaxID=368405 RepID=A0A8H9IB58_9ALTE|nr:MULTISPECIES: helix-turn-helix transcriptional regulator [Paraglaciecola]AEE23322.1 helix-turn-helix domain protein [Glaciecola sp. 4H-3-7+YE-5]MBN27098.1 XRE family transcriptional regulator [Alteromonadaceae bacterium]MBJ2136033.1 helix-turn-helix transcriptional regulator [Paraglaciecola chathamensis]MBU3019522.1 helix-turn-helix transcriptional regulator [Paraglaciecola agarilytica]MDO6561431.1 helix-turn-helix transcriptional regulator [Paraglaciecola chathamensis]|tara:strand:- start:388 stop:660 length:273 start_codon:yes stop_codon:yes gene_type:complete